jgi:hypothetical protein
MYLNDAHSTQPYSLLALVGDEELEVVWEAEVSNRFKMGAEDGRLLRFLESIPHIRWGTGGQRLLGSSGKPGEEELGVDESRDSQRLPEGRRGFGQNARRHELRRRGGVRARAGLDPEKRRGDEGRRQGTG